MRDLLHQLTAVSPEASGQLHIITFFDALLESRAGLEAHLRGAAALAGCPVGLRDPSHRLELRLSQDGRRLAMPANGPEAGWPIQQVTPDGSGVVWLERTEDECAADRMVLERCALGLRLTIERTRAPERNTEDDAAIEMLIDDTEPVEIRRRAARRLRLSASDRVVVTASTASWVPPRQTFSVVKSTDVGVVRATLSLSTPPVTDSFDPALFGISPPTTPDELPVAWARALAVLRLASPSRPVQHWDDAGVLAMLGACVDRSVGPAHADEAGIAGCLTESWSEATLTAILATDSVRAAAVRLGVHHSTVQARVERLVVLLGYDPSAPQGRIRAATALALHRFRTNRFDS